MTLPDAIERLREGRMSIGGTWVPSSDGASLPNVDPSTREVIGQIADASLDDVDTAVGAAQAALPAWRSQSPSQRGERLRRLAAVLEQHEDELALIDAVDSGNPLGAMLDDVRGACRELRLFGGLASEIKGNSVLNGDAQFAYGVREPYGVVGRIIPFNHPLKFAAGKIAAALVAGNTIVLKPAEQTSLSAIRLGELAEGILPPGVLNIVTGRGEQAGAALAAHPGVPRIAFTGGVPAGRAVLHAGADTMKHVTLELGGKNPMIVFPDVDVAKAAAAAVKGMNFARSQGQSCQSNSRVYVHRDIEAAFASAVVEIVEGLRLGNPLEPDTDLGPLAYEAHYERVVDYIGAGRAEGATLATGNSPTDLPGFFVRPAVFTGVEQHMTIAREEIFGPVLSIIGWDDLDEVVAAANDSPFGLTANIWTNDLSAAHRTAHRIDAGYVWINGVGKRVPATPFGGYKQSGLGKESSLEEILEFTRLKTVAVGL